VKTRLARKLKELGIPIKVLAHLIGCSPRSIHNEASAPKSLALRKKIQAAIGVQVWDDVPLTGVIHTFGPDEWLEFSDTKTARAWARLFNKIQPRVAALRGQEVRYRSPITVMVSLINPPSPRRNLFTRTGNAIQVNEECEIAVNPPPKQVSPGTEIVFPTAEDARTAISGLRPGIAKRRGRIVTFTVPATFTAIAKPKREAAARKESKNRS